MLARARDIFRKKSKDLGRERLMEARGESGAAGASREGPKIYDEGGA